jgi:DNA-directed RNA polymerase specialized sigma24 family protein
LAEQLQAQSEDEYGPGSSVDWVLHSDRIAWAERALAELEPLDARLLHCRYYLQWTYAQIATELSLNHDAVTNGLRRAKRSLRARVEELSKEDRES